MSESLDSIVKDDPVTCETYTNENNLLDTLGWKLFCSIDKREINCHALSTKQKLDHIETSPNTNSDSVYQ